MKCPFCKKVLGPDDEVINKVCDCGVGFLCFPGTREPTEEETEMISKLLLASTPKMENMNREP